MLEHKRQTKQDAKDNDDFSLLETIYLWAQMPLWRHLNHVIEKLSLRHPPLKFSKANINNVEPDNFDLDPDDDFEADCFCKSSLS